MVTVLPHGLYVTISNHTLYFEWYHNAGTAQASSYPVARAAVESSARGSFKPNQEIYRSMSLGSRRPLTTVPLAEYICLPNIEGLLQIAASFSCREAAYAPMQLLNGGNQQLNQTDLSRFKPKSPETRGGGFDVPCDTGREGSGGEELVTDGV